MCGGRVELGPRQRLVRAASTPPTASRSRPSASASTGSRSSWPSSPACGRRPPGERFTCAGTHYQLTDSPALPKPVQSPRPPVIIGGWGKTRTPRLAARFADEFNVPFPPLAAFGGQVDAVRAACEAVEPRPRDDDVLGRRRGGVRRGRGRAYRRRAAAIGRDPDELRENGAGRDGRRGHRPAGGRSPRPAPSASTSRCWTCPTSTTCGCWPRRWRRRCGRSARHCRGPPARRSGGG